MALVEADTGYYLFEAGGVDFRDFDLNKLLSFDDFAFFGDVDVIFDGRRFEDIVGYYDDEIDGVSFAGRGIRIANEHMVAGTIEAVGFSHWEIGVVADIYDVSLPAFAVMSAMLSPTFSDDLKLWSDAFSGADVFRLTDSVDAMRGFGGDDRMAGRAGNDTLSGDNGDDQIWGGADADRLFGQNGEDSLFGGSGQDELRGGNDRDALYGGVGADALIGGTEADLLVGGVGLDVLRGGQGGDRLRGGADQDKLFGNAGEDILHGGGQADRLFGGAQDDRLFGGSGRDRLDGGSGNDDLYGGGGRDTFAFNPVSGSDQIHDFEAGRDLLLFRGTADDDPSDLGFSQDGDWLVIDHAEGEVRLKGYTEADVAGSWFDFA